ncbi:hypothetical protein [Amycolatopsis sp. NPDC051716]|uniref:hypothetical protein n=1 Tax=Amycolatopsis sp. NPDC051716 TaxID=3155804 RepID=UPI0034231C10
MSATAGAVAGPVVRSAVPVIEPVASAAKALLSPLAKTAAAVVEPLVAAPLTGLVDALGSVVAPVARPVLGTASPALTDLLTPGAGAPVAEFAAAPEAGFAVQAVLPLARVVTSPPANQQLVPTVAGGPAAADAQAQPVSPACARATATAATAEAGPHRGAARHPASRLGGHRPGQPPAHPGVPVSSSDVVSGGGSSFPPAFLAAGHVPHHFRASPWTHGDFVPLWRPSEPGTGPG